MRRTIRSISSSCSRHALMAAISSGSRRSNSRVARGGLAIPPGGLSAISASTGPASRHQAQRGGRGRRGWTREREKGRTWGPPARPIPDPGHEGRGDGMGAHRYRGHVLGAVGLAGGVLGRRDKLARPSRPGTRRSASRRCAWSGRRPPKAQPAPPQPPPSELRIRYRRIVTPPSAGWRPASTWWYRPGRRGRSRPPPAGAPR
jgi:hypothetical protein